MSFKTKLYIVTKVSFPYDVMKTVFNDNNDDARMIAESKNDDNNTFE